MFNSHVCLSDGAEVLLLQGDQLRHKLPLLVQKILDHLLPELHPLLGDLGRQGRVGRVTLEAGVLLDVVGREPARLPVQGALPPAALLALGQRDVLAFLEVELFPGKKYRKE